jgi:hypothetical protein
MQELLGRASGSVQEGNWERKLCRGRLLSHVHYEVDLNEWGYEDGRAWDEKDREREDGALATGHTSSVHGPH